MKLDSFKTVIKNARRWKASKTIKEYIVAVEHEAITKRHDTAIKCHGNNGHPLFLVG
jgi:hypothetical protein